MAYSFGVSPTSFIGQGRRPQRSVTNHGPFAQNAVLTAADVARTRDAMANGWSPLSRQPLYGPAHPNYQPPQAGTLVQNASGPLAATSMRAPMAAGRTPVAGPLGNTAPSSGYSPMTQYLLQGGPGGGPLYAPGSGNVHTYGFGREPQLMGTEQAAVTRQRNADAAAGSGPYDNAYGRYDGVAPPQQHVQRDVPVGTRYAGGSRVVEIDGRRVLLGPNESEGNYRNTAAGMAGSKGIAYRSSGPPAGGLSPEMEQRRLAAIEKYRGRDQMQRAGRNIRANREYGAPLRPDMFPMAQQAYQPQGVGPLAKSDEALVNRFTTDEGTDYAGMAKGFYDRYRNDPAAAREKMLAAGMTSDDIADAMDGAKGGFFGGGDPEYAAWLAKVMGSGTAPAAPGAPQTGPLGTPVAPQSAFAWQGPPAPGQTMPPAPEAPLRFNPFDPVNPILGKLPRFGFDPTNPFNPFPRRK